MKDNKYFFQIPRTQNNSKDKNSDFPYNKDMRTKSFKINYSSYDSLAKLPSPFINVFCRFHPINELEYLYSKDDCIKIKSPTKLILNYKNLNDSNEYIFDEIFEQNLHISSFYDKTCKNLINALIQGYNTGIILLGDIDSYSIYILKEIIPQIIRQIYLNILYNTNDEIFKSEFAVYGLLQDKIINLIAEKSINNTVEKNNKIFYNHCHNQNEMENKISSALNSKTLIDNIDKIHLIIEIKIYRYDKNKNLLKLGKLKLIKLKNFETNECSKNIISKEKDNINQPKNNFDEIINDIINKKNNEDDEINEDQLKENNLSSILWNYIGGNSFANFILTCSKSEYQIETTKKLFEISKNIKKIKNNPLINVEVYKNSNPLIQEILINNMNNTSKKLEDEKCDNENKNNFRFKNNINYKFDYISNEKFNNKLIDNSPKFKYSFSEKKKNNKILKTKSYLSENITKNKNVKSLFTDNNNNQKQISKYKAQINELKLIIKEKESKILKLNNEVNEKKSDILLLSIEKDKILNKIEDELSEKDEKILKMERDIYNEKKLMENNLYSQIKNSEVIIKEITKENKQKDEIIIQYKDDIEKYNLKMKELEIKYKNSIDENKQKNSDYELKINNYEMKISQLSNDIYIKDSIIQKMKGEIQILKSELSNNEFNKTKNNSNNVINNEIKNSKILKEEENLKIEKNSSKINNLENELNSMKIEQKEISFINQNKDFELKLKKNQIIIDEYKTKNEILNEKLFEAKNSILNLEMEKANIILEKNKELLDMDKNKNSIYIKNKELEKELEHLRKLAQDLKNENDDLKKKIENSGEEKSN